MTKRHQYIFAAVAFLVLWVIGADLNPLYGAPLLIGNVTGLPERAAIVQRDMADAVMEFRPSRARTLATFEQGTRKKTARLAGLQMGYWKDRANGQTLYSPVAGSTSFKKSTKQNTGAMYAGVVFRNMNIWLEAHVLKDMERGFIPDSYIQERRRRISTHQWKKNMAAIGNGTGALAKVSIDASGSTVTVLADNSARGTSKGCAWLQESSSADPLYYDCVDSTDTVTATFYISAKLSATTFTAAGFTVGAITDIDQNDFICESGQWKKEMQGLGSHISDSTSRIYQSADVAVDTFLQNPSVDAGSVAVTPSAVHSAKGIMMTRCNQEEGALSFIGHISWGNYRNLAKFGYVTRQAKNDDMKTYGLPNVYEDGDTMWVPDTMYEDAYIDLRERGPFFEYVQKEFGLKTVGDGPGRHEWIGTNEVGSTNEYENYNEACNIVWDGKGKDGSGPEGGSPNTSVFIKSIALPAERESVYGV